MIRSIIVATFMTCAMLVTLALASAAQIVPDPDALADPRPDPLLLAPVISAQTQIRVVGTVQGRAKVDAADAVDAADYLVAGRLTVFPPTGSALAFDVALQTIPDSLAPFRAGFTGTIKMFELIGDVPANSGATLTLDCLNCPRGSRISGGMHLEDISLVPAFPAYAAHVIDPMIDGAIDVDSSVPLPLISAASQLQVFGVVHLTRGVRDPDTVGHLPAIVGLVTLQLPDGTSRWFDITLHTLEEKDLPARYGFSGVIAPALIGETPTNSSATLTLACVNCPSGAVINAGVYVEEISVGGQPSFSPYVVSLTPAVPDPIRRGARKSESH